MDASATLNTLVLQGPPAVSAMHSSIQTALRHLEKHSTSNIPVRKAVDPGRSGQSRWLQGDWSPFTTTPRPAPENPSGTVAPQWTASWRQGFSTLSSHVQQQSQKSVRATEALMHESFGLNRSQTHNAPSGDVLQRITPQQQEEGKRGDLSIQAASGEDKGCVQAGHLTPLEEEVCRPAQQVPEKAVCRSAGSERSSVSPVRQAEQVVLSDREVCRPAGCAGSSDTPASQADQFALSEGEGRRPAGHAAFSDRLLSQAEQVALPDGEVCRPADHAECLDTSAGKAPQIKRPEDDVHRTYGDAGSSETTARLLSNQAAIHHHVAETSATEETDPRHGTENAASKAAAPPLGSHMSAN